MQTTTCLSIVLVVTMGSFLIGCTGCGQLIEDDISDSATEAEAGDASDASASAPCTSGPFTTISPLTEINTSTGNERGFRLTSDELLAAFSGPNQDDAGAVFSPETIFMTTRLSRTQPFAEPTEALIFANRITNSELRPSFASNGLSLFTEDDCQSTAQDYESILCLSTRTDGGQLFGGDDPILNFFDMTSGPFGLGYKIGDGYVTGDGLAYYFVGPTSGAFIVSTTYDSGVDDGGGTGTAYSIFASHNPTNGVFQSVDGTVLVPSDPTIVVDNPIVTSDELTLFVSTTTTANSVPHIQSATRASTTESFGALSPLHEIDSTEGEYPTWISPDQCRLYLTRTVGGQTDILVASRVPH